MNNLVVMPLLIPLVTGVLLIFCKNQVNLQRWISGISVIMNTVCAALLVREVHENGILTLSMSGWDAPYGIVFVADMFASLLVLTTTIVSSICLFYAFGSIGRERETHYFYPFMQFLTVGVIGSFLTGDIFNLFVCFEIMLISSYALIVLGGTKKQLRESLKYLLINIISSTLFVASVAYLYGVVGTLNMADLSLRIAETGQDGILNVVAMLFLIVFSLKAGLFLFYWLPGSYSAPPPVIIALFSGLLTKVGLYAIIRVFTLIFAHSDFMNSVIAWMAVISMIAGVIGAVAYSDVYRILIYNIVYGVGFVAFGLAVSNEQSMNGAVYYLMNDMLVKTLLFLLGGAMIMAAGTEKLKEMGGLIRRYPLLGWLFFVAAMALVGVPPLSGFIGKLLIVQGGFHAEMYWLTGISLFSSLLVLYSVIKLFIGAFWGEPADALQRTEPIKLGRLLAPSAVLVALVVWMGIGAEWIIPYVHEAGNVLLDPQLYIQAVLKE
ncbi:Na+/H+ antiporter subunit D [Marinicrinis lubricantis]|uniref:Na+/H+ antiporter subunit D n=1 Tax=Marinicrinis lubricantis TaxID=2086470 RepID=A0ABW1IJT8_9BACL